MKSRRFRMTRDRTRLEITGGERELRAAVVAVFSDEKLLPGHWVLHENSGEGWMLREDRKIAKLSSRQVAALRKAKGAGPDAERKAVLAVCAVVSK